MATLEIFDEEKPTLPSAHDYGVSMVMPDGSRIAIARHIPMTDVQQVIKEFYL